MRTILNVLLLLSLSATPAMAAGDLIVKGDLGVGTTTPDAKLDVRGGVKIGGADAVCSAATEGMVRYNSTEKRAEFCDGTGWMRVVNGAPIDVTNAATDYPLKVGETAYVNYTSATSVAMNIATVPGLYEINIQGSRTALPSGGYTAFKANNTVQSAAWSVSEIYMRSNAVNVSGYNVSSPNAVYWGEGAPILSRLLVSTETNAKSVILDSTTETTSYKFVEHTTAVWNDTTTHWTSLGTLVIPMAQSGRIVIRRLM